MDLSQIRTDIYRFIVGLLGALSILLLFKFIKIPSAVKDVILFVGKNTLGIYIISDLCATFLRMASKTIVTEFHLGITIVEIVIILLFSAMVTELIKKNKLTRKLLLGAKK